MQISTPILVDSITVHARDTRVRRLIHNTQSKPPPVGGTRGKVSELSVASRRRLLFAARNTPGIAAMLTVTYPGHVCKVTGADLGYAWMSDGRLVKEHLRRFRQALTRLGVYGVWFLEFQSRGAPHIHWLLGGPTISDAHVVRLRRLWYRIVGSGDPLHLEHGMDYRKLPDQDAAPYYAAKYSAKDEQKIVPEAFREVGRMWGVFNFRQEQARTLIPARDFFELTRIIRRAERAQRRANGYVRKRKYSGSGVVGFTGFDVSAAIFYFLRWRGLMPPGPGNPRQLPVVCSRTRTTPV